MLRCAWQVHWRKIILDALMTIMSAHKYAKKEDFDNDEDDHHYWLSKCKQVKVLFVRRTYHERVLDDHLVFSILRTGVQVSFVRDENKKRRVFLQGLCRLL